MRKVSTFLYALLVCSFLTQTNVSYAQTSAKKNLPSKSAVTVFPWTESFETDVPPASWEHLSNTPNKGWSKNDGKTHGPNSVADGQYAAMFNCYNLKKDSTATLSSPVLDLSALSNATLSFWIQCKTGSSPQPVFMVEYSTDGGASYDTIFNQEADGKWDNWTEVKIPIIQKSNNCKIKFRGISDWGSYNLFLDKVKVYQPTQMQYVSATVTQNNTELVYTNSKKNEIIGIKVNVTGELNPVDIDQFTFTLNGTSNTNDISKLQVFFTGNDNNFSANSLFGETTSISSGNITINSKNTNSPKLKAGDNYFWLTADVSSSANSNNKIDATCESLKIETAVHNPNPKTVTGERNILKALVMQSGTNNVTINSDYLFFDDGGSDANYSENFEGTITFKPQDANKKIKINWSDFQVFVYDNDPSINWSKNDIFKVYMGNTADENKLIDRYYGYTNPTNYQKENNAPTSIISTETDGSLTVYFKVRTSSVKKGWSATVSQITPTDMTYKSSDVKNTNDNNIVTAEETGVSLFKLSVKTENTLNPITLNKITLDLTGTNVLNDFSKISVYATGIKNTFSTSKKVGEITSVSQNETTISFSNPEILKQGVNYFWVTCDIANTAIHNNKLNIKCKNFTHSGSVDAISPTTNSTLTISKTVDNTYKMPVSGTYTKSISNKIAFTDNNEGYSGKYKATKDVATVTFSPATPGDNVKISFQEFEVYYSSSSYGTKAIFEIYDGNSTSSNLIWKADKDNKYKGPESIVSASNGSLTIKFSANTTSSSYAKKGWKAQVWSETPTNMAYKSDTTEQITGFLSQASVNQQILKINIKLSGTLNPINNSVFTFNTNGTSNTANITKANLYFTNNSDEFSTTQQSGSTINNPNGDFTFTCTETLAEGDNYFWLAYDISDDATIGNLIDAQFTKIKLGNNSEQSITNGNPNGNRSIKNIYLMANGTNVINVNQTPLEFFDDGGADNKYGVITGLVTFMPQPTTNRVKLNISELELEQYAYFEIYNGNKKELTQRLKNFKPTDNTTSTDEPYVFKSTANDGSLSVYFKRGSYNSSSNKAGWKAQLVSYVPSNTVFDSAWAEQQTNDVWRGGEGAILKIPIIFKGEINNAAIESLTFTTNNGTKTSKASNIISKAKVYSTGTNNTFDPFLATLLGETDNISGNSFTITSNFNVSGEQTHYLWLCYEISASANENSKLDATFTKIKVSGQNHNIVKGNPDGTTNVKSGMAGLYTIGYDSGTKNFINFENAINALNTNGIEDKVIFKIADGIYNEQIKIPHINGVSANNTITFESASEDASMVTIQSDDYTAPTGSDKTGIFHFDGVDFITIKNITIKTTKKDFDAVIILTNKSRNVTIENCMTEIPAGTSYSDGHCIYTYSKNEENSNNDNLCLKNNIFKGGRIGINIGGTGYVTLPKEQGLKIINNTFVGQYAKAIYVNNEKNIQVIGNTIINRTSTKNGFQGIDLYRIIGKSEIYNNYVSLELTKSCKGIEFRPITGETTNKNIVYNNVVAIKSAVGSSYGVLLDDKCTNTDFYYNTILISGTSTSSNAFGVLGSSSEVPENIIVKNNIFVNNAGGYATRISRNEFKSGFVFDFNNIYSSGSNIARIGSSNLNNLTAWQGQVTATNSISESVEFYTLSDLHIKVANNLQNATPIGLINLDFDGETRSTTKPTMGAYKYITPNLNAPLFVTNYPKSNNTNHFKTTIEIASQSNANAYWVVLPTDSTAPNIDKIKVGQSASSIAINTNQKGQVEVFKNKVQFLEASNLQENSNYKAYIVLENNIENTANTLKTCEFKTMYRPTEPSTFESITTGSDDFTDGTSHFKGLEVIEGTGAFSSSNKYAKILDGKELRISITNTDTGLVAKGLFIKNDTLVKIKGVKADGTFTNVLKVPKRNSWDYIELTSLGQVKQIVFEPCDKSYNIDDFNGNPQPLKVVVAANNSPILLNGNTDISSVVTGGIKPYKYSWLPKKDIDNPYKAMPNVSPKYSTEYTLTVSDAQNKKASYSTVVEVLGNVGELDFDDLSLDSESYWKPKTDGTQKKYSKGFEFKQTVSFNGFAWNGFSFSNKTNNNEPGGVKEQWTSITGAGAKNSKNYAIFYLRTDGGGIIDERITVSGANDTIISGMFVTNNTYNVTSMENGDSFAKKFGGADGTDPDWFKLTIIGYDKNNTKTSSVDFYLADFRSPNSNEDYIVKDWRWVDLTGLGEVKYIQLELTSSDSGMYGMNTPAYACFDNINGNKADSPPVVANKVADVKVLENADDYTVDLSGVFDDPDSDNNKITITTSSSDSSLVIGTVNEQTLTLAFADNKFGQASTTLVANSNGKTVETAFSVYVTENKAPEKYENGVLFVNEGWFGHEYGSVNFLNKENKMNYRAYTNKNNDSLGITTQFGTIYGNNLYLVSKQGKRLVVADAVTLEKKAVIKEFKENETGNKSDGRAFVGVSTDKGYVSTSKGVYVFDIKSLSIKNKIENINTEVGNMLHVNNFVIAVSKDTVFVIDATTDKVNKTITGGKYAGLTRTIDGNIWVGADTSLMKINANDISFEYIKLPKNAKIPNPSWAWNAVSLCAGIKDNSVYWTESGWSPKNIYKFTGDTTSLQKPFIELNNLEFYGAGIRINPETNELIATVKKPGWGSNYAKNTVIKYNGETGEQLNEIKLFEHYWFPAMPVFTDKAPTVKTLANISGVVGVAPQKISIKNLFSDADNDVKIIRKTIQTSSDDIVEAVIESNNIVLTLKAEGTANITVKGLSNGKVAETSFKVEVKPKVDFGIATFEEQKLESETYWKPQNDGIYSFIDAGFEFPQNVSFSGMAWNGISYSNKTNKDEAGSFANAHTAITGKGFDNSKNYAVAYVMGETKIKIHGDKDGNILKGMFITNSTYAVTSMENGDSYSKKFGGADGTDPDWFKLQVFGYNKDNTVTDSLEFYLADFRSDNSEKDYIVKDWKFLDLKPLGKVSELGFKLSSSDVGKWGMNTPSYFCFDNLNDEKTGINQTLSDNLHKVNVYPNPANDIIFVETKFNVNYIEIINNMGKTINRFKTKIINNNKNEINISSLQSGIYLLKIVGNENTVIHNIIKR